MHLRTIYCSFRMNYSNHDILITSPAFNTSASCLPQVHNIIVSCVLLYRRYRVILGILATQPKHGHTEQYWLYAHWCVLADMRCFGHYNQCIL